MLFWMVRDPWDIGLSGIIKSEEFMKQSITGLLMLLLAVSVPGWATTRFVSSTGGGQYSLMSAAEAASVSGDTILIGPGNYSEASGITTSKRLTWIGAGWDQTQILSASQFNINGATSKGTSIEGIRWESSFFPFNFNSSTDSITIRRCLVKASGNQTVLYGQSGRVYVDDCIIIEAGNNTTVQVPPSAGMVFRNTVFVYGGTSTNAVFANSTGNAGTLEIYNCVFLNYQRIFSLNAGAQPTIAINNIFYDWGPAAAFGVYSPASIFDYNACDSLTAPGTNPLAMGGVNPFVNYSKSLNYIEGTSDLHLVGGSPLIHTGNPGLLNTDNTRSDFGVYGGPKPLVDNGVPNYPWAVNITASPNVVGQGTPVNATAVGRVGPQY
jgi:hypothetical protein